MSATEENSSAPVAEETSKPTPQENNENKENGDAGVDDGSYDLRSKAKVAQRSPIALQVEKGKVYYWCTCGRSKSQPLCDGSHVEANEELGTDFGPLAWTAEEDGTQYFCACKQTNNPPFCDGTHANLPADEAEAEKEVEEPPEPVDPMDTLEYYLSICDQFKLGALPTESCNPDTEKLSEQAKTDLPAALRTLQAVDLKALQTLAAAVPQIEELASTIHQVLESGHNVVMAGCGATGRLSLSLEIFALEGMIEEQYRDRIKGFMAGGDAALIRSIEKFEDRVEFGARQLHSLGFTDGDLMLAITEGGETPFVIAACEEAQKVSSVKPYFIYCNPDDILVKVADRSKKVIENEGIKKINVCVGPMAITGSTRMQATTVQVTVAGLAIQHHANPNKIRGQLALLTKAISTVRYDLLAPMTEAEAELYKNKEAFLYETDYFSITTMTDTTERAPTFSLPPFENFNNKKDVTSPVYLCLPSTSSVEESWKRLLRRDWRPLEWEETHKRTGLEALKGYDFSNQLVQRRAAAYGEEKTKYYMEVMKTDAGMRLTLKERDGIKTVAGNFPKTLKSASVAFGAALTPDLSLAINSDRLLSNIIAKCLLNAHSTLIMGLLGRFDGNIMTFVKPSNFKLIDRAARYVRIILERSGKFETTEVEELRSSIHQYLDQRDEHLTKVLGLEAKIEPMKDKIAMIRARVEAAREKADEYASKISDEHLARSSSTMKPPPVLTTLVTALKGSDYTNASGCKPVLSNTKRSVVQRMCEAINKAVGGDAEALRFFGQAKYAVNSNPALLAAKGDNPTLDNVVYWVDAATQIYDCYIDSERLGNTDEIAVWEDEMNSNRVAVSLCTKEIESNEAALKELVDSLKAKNNGEELLVLPTYERIVRKIFELRVDLTPEEPIVIKVANALIANPTPTPPPTPRNEPAEAEPTEQEAQATEDVVTEEQTQEGAEGEPVAATA